MKIICADNCPNRPIIWDIFENSSHHMSIVYVPDHKSDMSRQSKRIIDSYYKRHSYFRTDNLRDKVTSIWSLIQLNKYETDLYFLQNFQCKTIHAFCKICKHEIVFVLICSTGRTRRTISGSQLLQNTWIIKQTVVLLWKYWK